MDTDYDFYLKVPFTYDLPLGSIKYNLVGDGVNITTTPDYLASIIVEDTVEDDNKSNLEGTFYKKNSSRVKKLDNIIHGGVSTRLVIENVGVGHILTKEEVDPEYTEDEYRLYKYSINEDTMNEIATFALGEVMYTCHTTNLNNVEYLGVIDSDGKFTNKYILASLYKEDYSMTMLEDNNEFYFLYNLDVGIIKANTTSHYKLNM